MKQTLFALLALLVVAIPRLAGAQDQVWIQVEARPTLSQAEQRARSYAGEFGNVVGYRLNSGWYAVALGPYSRFDAEQTLRNFRLLGDIPADSFISDGRGYAQAFWPTGVATTPQAVAPRPEAAPEQVQAPVVDETPREARASEAQLDRSARENLQTALQWFGFYTSSIDGAIGPGTRRAMSEYQATSGDEVTGILTTAQRARLMAAYQSDLASLGMEAVSSAQAGIALDMPLGRVSFDRFEPPFVHYEGSEGAKALLISQAGTATTLRSLYDTMQTLEIVPREGPRTIGRESFTLEGRSGTIASYTYAVLEDGAVKGFTLVWPLSEDRLMARAAQMMRASFTPTEGVLDPALADPEAEQRIDLLAGLEIRKPLRTLSGFYVTGNGDVLTTDATLQSCGRVTIDGTEARVQLADPDLGIVILSPEERLAPISVARFAQAPARLQSEVAVAGYPYSGQLGAATLSFGQLADLRGLQGQETVSRLSIAVSPGDVGGPVFDATGQVLGMLLAQDGDGTRQLPEDVNFAAAASVLTDRLQAAGLSVGLSDGPGETLAPERLAQMAAGMTVLVACWD